MCVFLYVVCSGFNTIVLGHEQNRCDFMQTEKQEYKKTWTGHVTCGGNLIV